VYITPVARICCWRSVCPDFTVGCRQYLFPASGGGLHQ